MKNNDERRKNVFCPNCGKEIIIEEKNLDYRDYYSAMEFKSETSLEELTKDLEIKPEEDDGEID